MNGKLLFLVICQLTLVWLLLSEQLSYDDYAGAYKEMPAKETLVICRFLCAIFLHISLADELEQSLMFMKYAMNHPWKFASWSSAFFVGLF